MALQKGKNQLTTWLRLALGEYTKLGVTLSEIATVSRCLRVKVASVLQRKGTTYFLFSGARRLTLSHQQKSVIGKRAKLHPLANRIFSFAISYDQHDALFVKILCDEIFRR